jgi:N-acyl-phosphatidylethanolamine-hydrolysing phospholipase D
MQIAGITLGSILNIIKLKKNTAKYLVKLVFIFTIFNMLSCNLVMVAIRNVPAFFVPPKEVKNKIKEPVRPDVMLSALWIGHATVLIQIDDKVIITDPFLTETCGEFARRTVEPGIEITDIPPCDLVLVSHSHFDHLSLGSLEILDDNRKKTTTLVFPNEMENYLPNYDMKMVRLGNDNGYESGITGESKMINGMNVTAVFSQHWGGRYGLDGYIWGDNAFTGYIIEYKGITVYFAGDTGYDSVKFKKIGEKFKIDLAFIPIGPCSECNQCGTYNHVFPVDAYKLYKDIQAKWMVPIHYGTLQFAQADPMLPLSVFRKLIQPEDVESIRILDFGEQAVLLKK